MLVWKVYQLLFNQIQDVLDLAQNLVIQHLDKWLFLVNRYEAISTNANKNLLVNYS